MARLKKFYKDKQYERDRKREKIRKTVTYVVALCWLVGICITGVFQTDVMIVGTDFIALGIVTLLYVVFSVYIRVKNWKVMTKYDEPELRNAVVLWDDREKERAEIKTIRAITDFLCSCMGVALVILGILRLLGVI